MQKFKLAFIVITTAVLFISAGFDKYSKKLEKLGFTKIPIEGVLLSEEASQISTFYMFETEITNKQYAEFLKDLRDDGKQEAFFKCKIDSTLWDDALRFDNGYAEEYHLTSEFAEYPVVNISYEAALIFCEWLQSKVNSKNSKIEIRLPKETEWIYAAKGGKLEAEYPWENIGTGKKSDFELCNYNSPNDGTCLATNYAKSYYPNAYGLYNMSGNVAEMLDQKGRSKGGSWNNSLQEMKINSSDTYAGINPPSPFIGFRPIAIIH